MTLYLLLIYSIIITYLAFRWKRKIPPSKEVWEDKEMRVEVERHDISSVDVFINGTLFKTFIGSKKEKRKLGVKDDNSKSTRFN